MFILIRKIFIKNINAVTNGLQGINVGHSGTTGVLPGNGRADINPQTVVNHLVIDHKQQKMLKF